MTDLKRQILRSIAMTADHTETVSPHPDTMRLTAVEVLPVRVALTEASRRALDQLRRDDMRTYTFDAFKDHVLDAITDAEAFALDMLRFVARHDLTGIFWTEDLAFFVACDDAFAPAADSEPITPETLPALQKAIQDAGELDGPLLYVARRRGTCPRPGTYEPENEPLFEACAT